VSTKRKRQRKQRPSLSPAQIAASARQALSSGQFRDAISRFKELLKREPRAEWRAGLAAAYQGRARELTAKDMLKEALAIWKNLQHLCGDTPTDPEHVALLLRMGRTVEALRAYREAVGATGTKELAVLRTAFAARYLAGESGLDAALEPDDPVIAHGAAARDALGAYCRGDDAALEQALGRIPFRSPYRDWVQILKALAKLHEHPAGARELLGRIAPDSAFAPLQRAAQLVLLPEEDFLRALSQSTEREQQFAAILRGWSEQRLTLWRDLAKASDPPPAKLVLEWMRRHRDAIDEPWAHKRGLRLLIDGFPRNMSWISRWPGGRPSPLEQDLVAAWAAEEQSHPWQIWEAWMDVVGHLRRPSDPRAGSEDALRIALIQRRLADRWQMLEGPLREQMEEQLEKSLSFDPKDRATYVRLIGHYRRRRELKDARRLLDEALKHFPQDILVLNEALETAVAGEAFKKAAGFGQRILEIDPINRRARESLFEAYLSHTRKQIRKHRADLARKQLAAAAEWARGEAAAARTELLEGFLVFDGEDPKAGAAMLRQCTERLGSGLTGRLELALEAARLGHSPTELIKDLGLVKVREPEKADLLAFCSRLRETHEAGTAIPGESLEPFVSELKAGSKLNLSRAESEAVCEALRHSQLDSIRQAYARAALKRWRKLPIFEFHAFESKYEGRYWEVSGADFNRLERAWNRAREAGDTRTAHRIQELLREAEPVPPPFFHRGGPEESAHEMISMFEEMGLDALLDLLQNGPEGDQYKEMERRLGPNRVLELFEELLGAGSDSLDSPPFPMPSPKGRRSGRRKPKRRASDGDEDSAPDQPDSDQRDLFK
jgi:tetratricopeptide (TPR) repeat protein